MDQIRRGQLSEVWGLEGVDFYQEKGHWIPQFTVAAEEEEALQTKACASEKKDKLTVKIDKSSSSSEQSSHARPRSMTSCYPHTPPVMDPYRRLALYTAPQMYEQSLRNEMAYHELTGRCSSSNKSSQSHDLRGWDLQRSDLRPGSGQRLRVSNSWVAQQRTNNRSKNCSQQYRWYYLTEDNHWAPIDKKDNETINQCYESVQKHVASFVERSICIVNHFI